ncbi:DUF5666 domain-containing protein [Thiomicrorhabdus lithotrophica]|uniref:DUF5666 domain-containing protein n=1 Tax=Thiomicrorhabdus lithotrophica TaxID=2949997 RepID=A0ABY8CAC9_9GAMM|nr:DUF5666 domain-containing protein [Thiomicrorhabdus lithotrophica]WEJ62936.1 DUF5666 domain-containing protein [Thiomicrorhabdus lithotrophica]
MKLKTKLTALAAALAISIAGCGGGGDTTGDTAGIGGSGFISSGTITGFGSVYVNGVKFETDSATFDIEGDTSSNQANLSIGMIVKVYGTINTDGTTGTATSIVFDDELQGPIAGVIYSPALSTADTADSVSFTVLGVTVNADRITTNFDGATLFDSTAGNLVDGNHIEISGFFDSNGVLHASRIEKQSDSTVEMKGTVDNYVDVSNFDIVRLDSNNSVIVTVNVDASSASSIEGLPNGIADGAFIEVEGTYNSGSNTITADKVESEYFEIEDTDEFEVEGYITNFNSNSDFKINGMSIDASGAQIEPAGTALTNDLKVEAEGQIVNNVLIADEISLRGGEIKIEAPVSSVDTLNNTLTIQATTLPDFITIEVGNETEFRDEVNDTEPFYLENINNSMHVAIEGFELQNGNVFADKVVVIDGLDGIAVDGVLESFDAGAKTVTILGATFSALDGTTTYEQNDVILAPNSWATLEPKLNPNTTQIEVEDTNSDGIADKIEID